MTTSPPVKCLDAIWLSHSKTPIHLCASKKISTGDVYFPPLPSDSPLINEFCRITLSETGSLYSFTIIHPSPKSGRAPFILAYVDFAEKVRIFGRLQMSSSEERPIIGMSVTVGLEDKEDGYQRYVFLGEPCNV